MSIMINSKSIKSNTGYKGIYFRKNIGKFEAQLIYTKLSDNFTTKANIGCFETLKEAVKAREDFIKSLF